MGLLRISWYSFVRRLDAIPLCAWKKCSDAVDLCKIECEKIEFGIICNCNSVLHLSVLHLKRNAIEKRDWQRDWGLLSSKFEPAKAYLREQFRSLRSFPFSQMILHHSQFNNSNFLREYKITILGGVGVGKSALTVQFFQTSFITEYDPTIEDSYRKQIVVDGSPLIIDVVDSAGQGMPRLLNQEQVYRSMREKYLRSSDGFLLVYSVDSRDSFDACVELHRQITQIRNSLEFPCILVANKCDLAKKDKQVLESEGRQLARRIGCSFFECSAMYHVNVQEAFYGLVREVHENGLTRSID